MRTQKRGAGIAWAEPPAPTSDREIVISRVFDAPRDRVFAAFTEPERVAKWWGPRGFTTTTSEMDVRPGGVWRYMMHGPYGVDSPNRIRYLEIVRPSGSSTIRRGAERASRPSSGSR